MKTIDWHSNRSDLSQLVLLDRAPESDGIDLAAVRRYRQDRLRHEMALRGVDAVILSDPVNIRYATGTRNMQVFSLRATETAVGKLRDAIRPGITETELWSVMHQAVIAQNGDYCETRLLSAGQRTNPWFQEAAHHVIEPDSLIALDTDVVGCHGYYADFSRTFHAGPNEAN